MVEETLRERLSLGILPKGLGYAERFSNRQVAPNNVHAPVILLFLDLGPSLVEDLVHASHHFWGSAYLAEEDGLVETGTSSQLPCIEESPCERNQLTLSSVDGVRVQFSVHDVDPESSNVLVDEDSLPCNCLKGRDKRSLGLLHVLHSLSLIHQTVGPEPLWPKAPDVHRRLLVPVVLGSEDPRDRLGV